MIRKMMIGLVALVSGATFSAASQAQDLKLYVFSSGHSPSARVRC